MTCLSIEIQRLRSSVLGCRMERVGHLVEPWVAAVGAVTASRRSCCIGVSVSRIKDYHHHKRLTRAEDVVGSGSQDLGLDAAVLVGNLKHEVESKSARSRRAGRSDVGSRAWGDGEISVEASCQVGRALLGLLQAGVDALNELDCHRLV